MASEWQQTSSRGILPLEHVVLRRGGPVLARRRVSLLTIGTTRAVTSRRDRGAFPGVGLLPNPQPVQFGLEGGPVDRRRQRRRVVRRRAPMVSHALLQSSVRSLLLERVELRPAPLGEFSVSVTFEDRSESRDGAPPAPPLDRVRRSWSRAPPTRFLCRVLQESALAYRGRPLGR